MALVGLVLFGVLGRGAGGLAAVRAAEEDLSYLSSTELEKLEVSLGQSDQVRPTGNTREFELVARPGRWELVEGVAVEANTYNGTVPGPTLQVTEGDTVRVTLKNELTQETSIHWHGLHIRNDMDGVPPFTQPAVRPGESFTYDFIASHAGTFMYHPHQNSVAQIDKGLYGAFIIDPQSQQATKFDREFTVVMGAWQVMENMESHEGNPMSGMAMDYNYFTLNGKAFPDTGPWTVKKGDLVRIRLLNISNLVHPMHLHGHDFKVVAKDGEALRPELQQVVNTLSVNAGETYDIVFLANNPGTWVFHCHELHHTTNNHVEPGGLMQLIQYEGYAPPSGQQHDGTDSARPAPEPAMPGNGHGGMH